MWRCALRNAWLLETTGWWGKGRVGLTSVPVSAKMGGSLESRFQPGCRSAVISQSSGADRPTTVAHAYCSTRCWRAIRAQPGSSEKMRGVGREAEDREDPGMGTGWVARQPSLLFETVFGLWRPRVSIVISHNIMACFSILTIWVAARKRQRRNPWFPFFLQKCSLPFYSRFASVYTTLQLVTSSQCIFTKRKVRLENRSQSQFFPLKSVLLNPKLFWSI